LIWQSREYLWMGPTAYLLLFLTIALPVWLAVVLLGRFRPPADARRFAAGCYIFLASLALLLLWPRLTRLAELILAAGIAVAASGVTFDRAIANSSWTLPSHGSIFTGRPVDELSANFNTPLDGSYPTIAERFRDHGYTTGAVVANTAYAGYDSGLARGFMQYD